VPAGIGFAKTLDGNLDLIQNLGAMRRAVLQVSVSLDIKVCVGLCESVFGVLLAEVEPRCCVCLTGCCLCSTGLCCADLCISTYAQHRMYAWLWAQRLSYCTVVLRCLPLLQGAFRHAPLLVGPSRKGFLGKLTGRTIAAERDAATVAACTVCVASGAADVVRVHAVKEVADGMKVADAVWRGWRPTSAQQQ
jgi:dihydropteroate synthase